jgi:hypothetical protein
VLPRDKRPRYALRVIRFEIYRIKKKEITLWQTAEPKQANQLFEKTREKILILLFIGQDFFLGNPDSWHFALLFLVLFCSPSPFFDIQHTNG